MNLFREKDGALRLEASTANELEALNLLFLAVRRMAAEADFCGCAAPSASELDKVNDSTLLECDQAPARSAEANTPYCTARKQNCIVLSPVDHLPLPQGDEMLDIRTSCGRCANCSADSGKPASDMGTAKCFSPDPV